MGYDLYHRNQPAEVTQARADDDWDRYFELQSETMCYWRESIWTMERFRSLLVEIGAVDLEAPPGSPDEPTVGLIPMGRLCCNSGWWITPEQCAMVVALFDEAAARDPGSMIRSYLDGTEQGTSHDLETAGAISTMLNSWDSTTSVAVGTNLTNDRATDLIQASVDIINIRRFFEGAVDADGIEVW